MMQDIESHQREKEKRIRELIEGLSEDEQSRSQWLKESLRQGRVSEAMKVMTNPGIEKSIEEELTEFEREKEELSLQLNCLLKKADSLRIKDFKKALKRLKAKRGEIESKEWRNRILFEQQKLQKEVIELLGNFRALQCSIETLWRKELSKI